MDLDVQRTETLTGVEVGWVIRKGEVLIELSYLCPDCAGYGCGARVCGGRVLETHTPLGLRARLGESTYGMLVAKVREALAL